MKKFDAIILELPEINLNEKKTRFGLNCPYGENGFGGCNDMREVVGHGDRHIDSPMFIQRTGEWVDRPVFNKGIGTLVQDKMHNEGCGGRVNPALRHKCWESYRNDDYRD